ncbi:MAG TPA: DnaT-like ssDNA-binding domain-containing protein [Cellvibrio sp.]|nr:DnaT-like ssDNA-binding domain-containing protein [Cellvibrio sp.]
MSSSLIPERPLLVSPSLAATIGLEEACMLSLLSEMAVWRPLIKRENREWLELGERTLERIMPFWSDHDIQRISKSLRDKGIILLSSAPFMESRRLCIAFNEAKPEPATHALPIVNMGTGANLIAPNWQPDREVIGQIRQHNIEESFIWQQLPDFILYWRERGEAHHSWGSKFLAHVKRNWVTHQTQLARQARENNEEFLQREKETAMYKGWRPSEDALETLVKHAKISMTFVEDAIPEFIIYWQENGEVGRVWNSKFIQHVKRQWVRYSSALEHDTEPTRIPENWQPNGNLFDVLKLANIEESFAKKQVAEFVLFWRESNQLYASWNTKFLQHVKYHWAKQHALAPITQQGNHHAGQQNTNPTRSTRDRSLAEDLTDRSWAR